MQRKTNCLVSIPSVVEAETTQQHPSMQSQNQSPNLEIFLFSGVHRVQETA